MMHTLLLTVGALLLREIDGFQLPRIAPLKGSLDRSRARPLPVRRTDKLFMLEEDATVTTFDLPDKIDALESDKYGYGRDASILKVLAVQAPQYCKIRNDGSVLDAIKAMNRINKGSALVMDKKGVVTGIFTERDFIKKVVEQNRKSSETPITEVMTPRESLITATAEMTIGECMEVMIANNIRHIPVMGDDGETVMGLAATTDLVKTIKQDDEMLGGQYPLKANYEDILAERANFLASQGDFGKQDFLRGGFVLSAAILGALLLQGNWVHDHYKLSMIVMFCLGYVGIIFESLFEFNKAAIALLMATGLWVTYAGTAGATGNAMAEALAQLTDKVAEVSEIIYFLIGAMTIVEIVDSHRGFKVVTDFVKTDSKKKLFWILGGIAFFMSGILDNLTTTIVMVSLLKKLVPSSKDRMIFGSLVVIAANAGGAWTPIGDVTTTMLWINGQISALATMKDLFIPSLVSTIISALVLVNLVAEDSNAPQTVQINGEQRLAPRGFLVFITGVLGLLSVPLFKALTGLPPYFGMLSALGVLWVLTDAVHADEEKRSELRVPEALSKIDTSGVLFFFGILMSVGALESAGLLRELAQLLSSKISSVEITASVIGAASAIIDNVPLVAASMGMYKLSQFPQDAELWQLIAFCAGTGGSMLVIGSAAGVALMGLEKVEFLWYAKNISLGALAGYVGGIFSYLALHSDVMSQLLRGFGF